MKLQKVHSGDGSDTLVDYETFLRSKIKINVHQGFLVDRDSLHPAMSEHSKTMAWWALREGRGLLAASFGLHKTRTQIGIAREVIKRNGGKFLIICPLGVKGQFQLEDGPALDTEWQYVRTDAEIEASTSPYLITNYERVRDGDIDPRKHNITGASLDEGSVLRSLGSKTYDVFAQAFADTPFKWVCTATPSPNNYKELIYYARFLGVMDVGQALTRWFKRDSAHAGNLTLHPHHEKDFWLWVSSWALFVYRPSDLGFSDEGYELPEMQVHWHRVDVDHTRAWGQVDNHGQQRLFLDAAGGVSEASTEKRETLYDRLDKALEIVGDAPDRHWLMWHHLEDERRAIEKLLPDAKTVYGSQDLEVREGLIYGFSHGDYRILATKPEIAGSGCNFQHYCADAVFLGVDYKFQDFIQAVHRIWRFLQRLTVNIHIIYAASEDAIVDSLKRKWQQHDELTAKMQEIVKKYGLSHEAMKRDLGRKVGITRIEKKGHLFTAVNNDCVDEIQRLGDNSVGLIHTSVPFGNHYEYSVQYEDFGHNPSDGDFWEQMDFLIPDLYRVLKPGRVAAIHVKDRILYGHQTKSGFMEVSPFSDECVMAFKKHGWMYEGRRTIVTDVVRENASTYRLGWSEMTKDASKMGSGLPEYLLLFRKPPTGKDTARADEPVTKSKEDYTRGRWQVDAHSSWRSNSNRLLTPAEIVDLLPDVASRYWKHEQGHTVYDHERHVAICEMVDKKGHLPSGFMLFPPGITNGDEDCMVWDDIVYMRTLNSEQSRGRQESHICPLPLDIVERVIRLYSNEGDLVLDPFGGLFTVPYLSIKMGRKAYGIELNNEYFSYGVKYCQEAEREVSMPTLFDFIARTMEPAEVAL